MIIIHELYNPVTHLENYPLPTFESFSATYIGRPICITIVYIDCNRGHNLREASVDIVALCHIDIFRFEYLQLFHKRVHERII